jgi:hypothetical protein
MRRLGATVATVAMILGSTVLSATAMATPPTNDNFADAQVLSGALPIAVGATNVEATRETNEPSHGFSGAGHSIWFEWTAPATGFVTIGTCGTGFTAEIGVYTGAAVNALTEVADSGSGGPGCPSAGRQATFRAIGSTTYAIAVDGDGFWLPGAPKPVTEGAIALQLEATPPPSNDDLAGALSLAGNVTEEPDGTRIYFAAAGGHNWGATKQAGEPDHAGDPGGASVWYAWTAPASGSARISVAGNWFDPLLAVYAGNSMGALTPIGSGFGWVGMQGIPVSAGVTYLIAVDGKRNSGTGAPSFAGHRLHLFMELPRAERLTPVSPDTASPQTTIKRVVKQGRRKAKLEFVSSEPATFRCRLDGRPFVACNSPQIYGGLKTGPHTFRVVAVDAAGNADPTPAVAHLTIPKPRKHQHRPR